MPLSNDDPFCVQPWFGCEKNTRCCWLKKDANISQVREDLLNGIRSDACSKCWKLEDTGQKSRRQQQNEIFDFCIDKDIEFIKEDVIKGKYNDCLYQITLSNLCNGTCVTCGYYASSAWGSLVDKKERYTDYDTINIDYNNAVSISILGGEPFLETTKVNNILNNLISANNTNCFISFTTNGSIMPKSSLIGLLNKFPNKNICVSIDGIGKVFDYMRYPLQWEKVSDNIKRLAYIMDITISYTESNINRLYREQTIKWFKENGFSYIDNKVVYPEYFSGEVMPETVKQLNWQDKLKGIGRRDYIPEWEEKYGNIGS